jgi:hypothetical protein
MDEDFDPSNVSFTVGRKRKTVTGRSTPLQGIRFQQDDYNSIFPLELYRVVLMINGLESPIVLFQAD